MIRHQVTASARVNAPPSRIYEIIADYRTGHPRILPPRYFRNLVVEQGGVGAGTVIRFEMLSPGRRQLMRATITEPEPGRVLVESYPDTRSTTTFIVSPGSNGRDAEVTFVTELETRGGLLGMLERRLITRFLQRVYAEELALLAAHAEGR